MIKSMVVAALIALSAVSTSEDPKPKCVENPNPDCFCTFQYDPVCGCNDVTYGNACMAECAGITKYKKGPCKEK